MTAVLEAPPVYLEFCTVAEYRPDPEPHWMGISMGLDEVINLPPITGL